MAESAQAPPADGFQVWHVYALLSMAGAAAAVWAARNTHPLALLLLSAAVLATGFVAYMAHKAIDAFLGRAGNVEPLGDRAREMLEREKALVLRSIKELEFDRAMGKLGDADFHSLQSRLRARALTLMQDLERVDRPTPSPSAGAAPVRTSAAPAAAQCAGCGTENDPDAKFCKHCGRKLEGAGAGRARSH